MPTLDGIKLTAFKYNAADSSWENKAYDTTDASGNYSITNLDAGDYIVRVSDPGASDETGVTRHAGTWVTYYYGDSLYFSDLPGDASAAINIISEEDEIKNITLYETPVIGGTITGTGASIVGLKVEAFALKLDGESWENWTNTTAAEDDSYGVRDLEPEFSYVLKVSDPGHDGSIDTVRAAGTWLTKYYGATGSADSLDGLINDTIPCPAFGASTTRDIALSAAASISGTVS